MRADKLGIVKILGQHHVRHGAHHGGIRARADGDPLVGQGGGAERMARVDANHMRASFARQLDKVIAVGAVAHFGRIPAPHQDVFRIQPVLALVAGDKRAVDGGRGQVGRTP